MDVAANVNRREFVIETAAGVGLLVLAGASAAAVAPAARAAPQPAPDGIDAGAVTEFNHPGVYQNLAASKRILLVRSADRLVAISAICTHKACAVKCPGGSSELKCSCHGSLFTLEGEVKKGPARAPLAHLGIAISEAGRVIVDSSQRFTHDKWDDPRSFVKLS
jgi:Rieske Fe-S protein